MGTTGLHRPPLPSSPRLEHAATRMRKIRTSRPGLAWVQAPGPMDLWTWMDDDGGIVAQEISFFGRTVLFKDGRVLTGLWEGEDRLPIPADAERYWVDSQRDAETLAAAVVVLDALPERAQPPDFDALRAAVANAYAGAIA